MTSFQRRKIHFLAQSFPCLGKAKQGAAPDSWHVSQALQCAGDPRAEPALHFHSREPWEEEQDKSCPLSPWNKGLSNPKFLVTTQEEPQEDEAFPCSLCHPGDPVPTTRCPGGCECCKELADQPAEGFGQ